MPGVVVRGTGRPGGLQSIGGPKPDGSPYTQPRAEPPPGFGAFLRLTGAPGAPEAYLHAADGPGTISPPPPRPPSESSPMTPGLRHLCILLLSFLALGQGSVAMAATQEGTPPAELAGQVPEVTGVEVAAE